jgi:membrane fusion protein, multidrug efflux system
MAENVPTKASPAATSTAPKATSAPAASPTPEDSGMNHAVWIVLILLVVGVVLGYLIFKNKKKPPARQPPPITVSVTNAVQGNIDEVVQGLGIVTPIYTAMISPRVDGLLLKVNYTEGQLVTTNDMLAEIDPGPYAALVTEAEGQLARDKALLEGALIDLDRFKAAYAKSVGTNVLHAIPKQQVDDQEALVHQDEGTVKYDEGQLANAKVQLAYCYIYAPFAGRAGLRLIDPGNVVHAANTNSLVTIAQLQPITVVFGLDQQYLPAIQRQLQAGHKMTVEAYAKDDSRKLATGTFQTLDNLIDTGTGNIRIKALFDNADMTLFPNQFVNAHLIIDTLSNVTLVPTPAIQHSPQGTFVYVVASEKVNVTNQNEITVTNLAVVRTNTVVQGITDVDVASVQGLAPGQVIVTDNYNKLADGMPVNVRRGGGSGRSNGAAPDGKKKGDKKDKSKQDDS